MNPEEIKLNVGAIVKAGGTSKDVKRYLDSKGIKYSVSSKEKSTNKVAGQTGKGEEAISKRQSVMADLIQNPVSLSSLQQHPIKEPLRMLGGGIEVLEGIPASIGLAAQRGRLQDIPKDVMATITGKRPAQLGDIPREAVLSTGNNAGVTIPEPISASIGLLAGASKFSPLSATTNVAAKGVGKAIQATKIIEKVGVPVVSKTLSVLSKIPEEQISNAIKNPNFLNPKWLKKEKEALDVLYDKTMKPLINSKKATVDTTGLSKKLVQELELLNPANEPTRAFVSMSKNEQNKIIKWLDVLKKGKISFNEADGVIAQMDEALSPVYRKMEKGSIVQFSDNFIRNVSKIRKQLSTAMKTQHSGAMAYLERKHNYHLATNVGRAFSDWAPHLMTAFVAQGMLSPFAPLTKTALPITLSTIPAVQGAAIRGGGILAGEAAKSGSLLPMAATRAMENR